MTRYRYARRSTVPGPVKAAGLVLAAVAVAGQLTHAAAHAGTHHAGIGHHAAQPAGAAAKAISYARAHLGDPYCWGGTGPSCYDCSGLMTAAWAAAGVTIPRTTFAEWSQLPHVPAGQAQPGDLVLAAGSDGTLANPGHVGMLLPGGYVLQAYATGYPINIVTLAVFGQGAGGVAGYVHPGGA